MSRKKKILVAALVVIAVVAAGVGYVFRSGTTEFYQHDADIIRLRDISELGSLIEEFRGKTGQYPLAGITDLDNYVTIATREQRKTSPAPPPYSHKRTSVGEFVKVLESGVGRPIRLPFNPQRVAVNKPNFYMYMIKGDTYFLAVHTHTAFPFARRIGKHYYKVEISNRAIPERKIWKYDELLGSEVFLRARSAKMNRPGYFESMREKMWNAGAF